MEILVKENKAELKGLPFDFEEHAKYLYSLTDEVGQIENIF